MNPFLKIWMFQHWLEDQNDKREETKNLSYSIGSFINPQAVQELVNAGDNTFATDDEAFDQLSNEIADFNRKQLEKEKPHRKRKKKIITT